ncbi:MAG: response regulator [Bacteroidota bacterium]
MINKILLLDDNKATNFIHKKFIRMTGCAKEVVSFEIGANALQYLEDKENSFPNLIFVDINMPTMNGWEFFEHFSKIDRVERESCRSILLTTSLSPNDEDQMAEVKAVDEILIKPLEPNAIGTIVEKYF